MFLNTPPVERVPIPDFRTGANLRVGHPSPDLLDTVYLCQRHQTWYRDYARSMHRPVLDFVGSARLEDDVVDTAARIRRSLRFDIEERRRLPTWTDALRRFIERADGLGVLVMVSGVGGGNSHRGLHPLEFRGFALADSLAPLVFVNGAGSRNSGRFWDRLNRIARISWGVRSPNQGGARVSPSQPKNHGAPNHAQKSCQSCPKTTQSSPLPNCGDWIELSAVIVATSPTSGKTCRGQRLPGNGQRNLRTDLDLIDAVAVV